MDKKNKLIYTASVIACVVILLEKYNYSYCQEEEQQITNTKVQKTTQPKKHVIPRPSIGNPAPYGIEIGNTTEEEIRDKFDVIAEDTSTKDSAYKMLSLNPRDFTSLELSISKIKLIFDQDGIVVSLLIIYDGHYFSKIHPNLSEKYKVTESDIPFVGTKTAGYSSNNVMISLMEPHLDHKTCLMYETNQFSNERDVYLKNKEQKEQERIKSLL